ncbi:MAG: hydroxymethylbilane synthase [Peptoniphilus sp.]|nr:hydroxymethylbilane synthase [Peptoniphilus sp.]MDD7363103.1 hydroxymethylbilane synthase [Bacillota bacterium]MDY6044375.1 hydroxymethylbilane synthase [Peptoniphilus sp.]
MKIRVGTRGSQLARIQAKQVTDILEEAGIETELVVVTTKGDRNQKLPIDKIGKNGVFVGELESVLVNGAIDIAVHSLKDMSSVLPEGFTLAAPPAAPPVWDVFVGKAPLKREEELAQMTIATGSQRRRAELHHFYPNILTTPIRGSIQTRIEKMRASEVDGTILAYAGLSRASLTSVISGILDPTRFIPSPSQGLLGIELSEARSDLLKIFEEASDPFDAFRLRIERAYQKTLDASCRSPIGIYIERAEKDALLLHGCFASTPGEALTYATVPSTFHTATADVVALAKKVKHHD